MCSSVCSVYNCLSFVCLLVSALTHTLRYQVYGFTLDWRAPNSKENTQSNSRKKERRKEWTCALEIVHVYLLYANKTSSILFADFILFDLICCGTWIKCDSKVCNAFNRKQNKLECANIAHRLMHSRMNPFIVISLLLLFTKFYK